MPAAGSASPVTRPQTDPQSALAEAEPSPGSASARRKAVACRRPADYGANARSKERPDTHAEEVASLGLWLSRRRRVLQANATPGPRELGWAACPLPPRDSSR